MASSSIRRILVPVDLSSCSRAALEFAGELGAALEGSLAVLYVLERASEPRASDGDQERAAAQTELGRFVETATLPPQIELTLRVEAGDARERIVAIAERDAFDMIVLGTHGRTGRPRSLAGSVAESVVRTALPPVVTVREGES